jgi:hypothetical protein
MYCSLDPGQLLVMYIPESRSENIWQKQFEVKEQLCTDKIAMDHVMNNCGGKIHYLIRRETFTVALRNCNALQKCTFVKPGLSWECVPAE